MSMKKDFNTHGGYFAPQGYLRINAGGSHEENPNGGVQLGTDEQGIPNMLEENEPVYNDYVYSDNIKADVEFLKKHNIPEKYAGKLFSEIADKFVDEAAERPMDPVSNNGLNAMLVRLAEAQDEQKQSEADDELAMQLSELSPEELSQLEATLDAQETQGQEEQQMASNEQIPLQDMPVQQMAAGGFIRRFDEGTPGETYVTVQHGPEGAGYSTAMSMDNFQGMTQSEAQQFVDSLSDSDREYFASHGFLRPTDSSGVLGFIGGGGSAIASAARTVGRSMPSVGRAAGTLLKSAGRGLKGMPGKLIEGAGRGEMLTEAGQVLSAAAKSGEHAAVRAERIAESLKSAKQALAANPGDANLAAEVKRLTELSSKADMANMGTAARTIGAVGKAAGKAAGAVTVGPLRNRAAFNAEVEAAKHAYETAKAAADAAPKSKKLKAAAEDALKAYEKVSGNWNKWVRHGEWPVKAGIIGGAAGMVRAASSGKRNNDWAESQFADGGFIRKFETGTPGVVEPEEDIYTDEYNDVVMEPTVPIGFTPDEIGLYGNTGFIPAAVVTAEKPRTQAVSAFDPSVFFGPSSPVDINQYITPVEEEHLDEPLPAGAPVPRARTSPGSAPQQLSTLPRYAGALTSGALALWNASQSPDRYTYRPFVPSLVQGSAPVRLQQFRPMDQNLLMNAARTQGAAQIRGLRNSGLGPSTAAAMLAADAATTRNMGNGLMQVWQANNQGRNAVVGANNSAVLQAHQLDQQRRQENAAALNQARQFNLANAQRVAMLNNQAVADKYNAISSNINNISEALSGIGQENFAMNQINSNPALMQYVSPFGWAQHKSTRTDNA